MTRILIALSLLLVSAMSPAAEPLDIGSRRELFVDDWLIDRFEGKAELRLQRPTPREIVLVHDAPWEGSGCGYHTVFRDGDLIRMYYIAADLTSELFADTSIDLLNVLVVWHCEQSAVVEG